METEFHHVGQAGLELLALNTSASQSVGITRMSQHTQPVFCFFLRGRVLFRHPRWSPVVRSQLTADLNSWAQMIFLILPPQLWDSWDCRWEPPHLANFLFLVETGFHHVGEAGLKLLTSGDLPASTSQSAGITGVSHHAWPMHFFIAFF